MVNIYPVDPYSTRPKDSPYNIHPLLATGSPRFFAGAAQAETVRRSTGRRGRRWRCGSISAFRRGGFSVFFESVVFPVLGLEFERLGDSKVRAAGWNNGL